MTRSERPVAGRSLQELALSGVVLLLGGCVSVRPYVPATAGPDLGTVQGRLQRILDEAVNAYGLPGVQAGLVLPDGRLIVASSGTQDFERRGAPIRDSDVFKVGSTTKMLVAALIGRLKDQERLHLDDTVGMWLPELPSLAEVTLRQLLGHRSGIPESLFTKPSILVKSMLSDHLSWDPLEVAQQVSRPPNADDLRTQAFHYSNNNYVLLGLIAERAGGAPIRTLLKR